jgi:hypothetical protein
MIDKKYKTRDGRAARIICTDKKGEKDYPVLALVTNQYGGENMQMLRADLQRPTENTPYLIEVPPYDDLEIDQPVIVWNKLSPKERRYFSGVDNIGKPTAFSDGRTSFTQGGIQKIPWDHCRPATEEEIRTGVIEE